MKKIIGVCPLWDDDKESLWMLPGYMDAVAAAGGMPIMLPLTTDEQEIIQLADMCDGLLFTGGHDVSPEIYHEERIDGMVDTCTERDQMEEILLREALKKDKAVLGICRGIQFINAALGGTLFQDIPSQFSHALDHHMVAPYDRAWHDVTVEKDSPLYDLLKKDKLGVNSYHHQAVKTLSPQLICMAKATDGIIEAVYKPDQRFVWAVQWHPEFSYKSDEDCMKIMKSFVDATY